MFLSSLELYRKKELGVGFALGDILRGERRKDMCFPLLSTLLLIQTCGREFFSSHPLLFVCTRVCFSHSAFLIQTQCTSRT